MQRKRIITEDGAHSFYVAELDEHYHSIYGAVQESEIVFIRAGLHYLLEEDRQEPIRILEIGFGTGLNALLTLKEVKASQVQIAYTTLEAYPISDGDAKELNFCEHVNANELMPQFLEMHRCDWSSIQSIDSQFEFRKIREKLEDHHPAPESFDLIFFDAFAPSAQPELWTEQVFAKLYASLSPGGVLVTYCAKGSVKRAMKAAGFRLEALPGPKNKREMTRAHKDVTG